MIIPIQININATLYWTYVGQYEPGGDTYRICEIHTKEPIEESLLLKLIDNKSKLPYEEWKQHTNNISDYCKGYYTLTKTDYGYKYEGVEPYTNLQLIINKDWKKLYAL